MTCNYRPLLACPAHLAPPPHSKPRPRPRPRHRHRHQFPSHARNQNHPRNKSTHSTPHHPLTSPHLNCTAPTNIFPSTQPNSWRNHSSPYSSSSSSSTTIATPRQLPIGCYALELIASSPTHLGFPRRRLELPPPIDTMGRSRSRSYSPVLFRRNRSRSPFRRTRRDDAGARRKAWRGRELGGRYSSAPTSLLVRNIARDSRPEDVRIPFERFGTVKDVYLPKDYYSGEPRGFGFVQYLDPADAADAQFRMDRQTIAGREITVVFAEDNRKKPSEMRVMERSRGGGGFRSDKYRRGTGRGIRSSSRSRSPPARRHSSRERFAGAREKRSKHGASSPDANGQGAAKSSLSPRAARSSASNSESLE